LSGCDLNNAYGLSLHLTSVSREIDGSSEVEVGSGRRGRCKRGGGIRAKCCSIVWRSAEVIIIALCLDIYAFCFPELASRGASRWCGIIADGELREAGSACLSLY